MEEQITPSREEYLAGLNNIFFKLVYSFHAKVRTEERVGFFKIIPTVIRISDENLVEVKGMTAKLRLQYTPAQDVLLIVEPNLLTKTAYVVTFFFKKRISRNRIVTPATPPESETPKNEPLPETQPKTAHDDFNWDDAASKKIKKIR